MLQKVMFLLPSLGGGGAERTVIQLANSFAEQGLKIDLAVCDLTGNKSQLRSEVSDKIRLIDFACGRVAHALMPLKRQLQAESYDCLVATQTHTNIVAAVAKKMAGVSTRLIFREVSTPSKNMQQQGLAKFILKKLVQWSYASAQQVVCVSRGVESDFRGYYDYRNHNLSTIYNPVLDASYFLKLQAAVSHAYFQPEHQVILAVGRLTEAKNFALLIRAFHALYQQRPELRLIILGEGELRAQLSALIAELHLNEVVDLAGFDANPYAYFKYVDLFVLSSNWEGLPGVLIQALASKVSVLSTDCPSGPREILAQGKFGQLVPCDDPIQMTQAMQIALDKQYPTSASAEFERHIQQFHKTTVLAQYLNLMESAA